MVRVWVDTDVGTNPDDAVALLVARAHPGVELVGVSVTGDGRGWRAEVAGELVPGVAVVGGGGVDEVVEAIGAAAPEVVVGIGPLTNLAATLPALLGARVTVMGGAVAPVWHRGAWRDVESNFGADPAAARAVLAAGRLTVVPLDVTVGTGLDEDGERRLLAAAPELREHVEGWRRERPGAAVHLHDPAALLVAVGDGDRVGAGLERVSLTVDDKGRMAVARRGRTRQNLVTSLDAKAVLERVVHVLTASR